MRTNDFGENADGMKKKSTIFIRKIKTLNKITRIDEVRDNFVMQNILRQNVSNDLSILQLAFNYS